MGGYLLKIIFTYMSEIFITYENKRYKCLEPTIETWSEIMKHRDLMDEQEMFVKTLELLTPLTREQILSADASEVYRAGETIIAALSENRKIIKGKIEHNGVEYDFIDIADLSFGQFIDIDTFLSKDELYKRANLAELASYLYIESGTKYGDKPSKQRQKAFKDLPMKYLEGAVFFLMSSVKTCEQLIAIYSQSKLIHLTIKTKIILALIGAGIQQSAHYVKTKFGYLIHLLAYPLLCVSITLLTLWTIIRSSTANKKK